MAFDYSHIGERIRYYRTKAGMSQTELASALYISSSHYISRLENGKDAPSLELIISMAEIFHVRTDDLLTECKASEGNEAPHMNLLSDCPQEIEPVLFRIVTAIKNILVEDYRK